MGSRPRGGTKPPASEALTLRAVETAITERLPTGWNLRVVKEQALGSKRPDAIFRVKSPDGETVDFVVEVKQAATPQSLRDVVEQMRSYLAAMPARPQQALVVAPYLSPRAQEVLEAEGVSYGDTTGNLRLTADRPGLFVEVAGATKDPWPDDQPLRSLRGRGAGRAVRAIVDFRPPYGVRELAEKATVSAATLSRVAELLVREALLTKDDKGGILEVDWARVLRRWSLDYEVRRSKSTTAYLEPRGLSALTDKLGQARWQYAVTGSVAAQRFAPIAPSKQAVIYVSDVAQAAKRLGLREADAGANVLLAEPFDRVVFERTAVRDGLVTVAPTQLAVDLLTGPGREPSEGEELLKWMKVNQDAWRA
jgi:hypothetical protein